MTRAMLLVLNVMVFSRLSWQKQASVEVDQLPEGNIFLHLANDFMRGYCSARVFIPVGIGQVGDIFACCAIF